mgnify:CR=1 FL=1
MIFWINSKFLSESDENLLLNFLAYLSNKNYVGYRRSYEIIYKIYLG